MNDRERFRAIFDYQPCDRLPAYFFGTWDETRERWRREGIADGMSAADATGMDADWEEGMWDNHGMVTTRPIAPGAWAVLEETDEYRVTKSPTGAVYKEGRKGSSIPQHIKEALEPTRESWERFKTFLNVDDPARYQPGWEVRALELNSRSRVATFMAGSLYGWPRDWMGVEQISYLAYDDPALFEEIIEHMADFFMALHRPILEKTQFDFAYFFEDCCFNTGPLFSPAIYRQFYDRHYRRMIDFYHKMGVPFVMVDSDGKVDELIPCWLESGFDIVFPIEVGTWHADPVRLRRQFGKSLRMFGGVDKHVIPQGEAAIRRHLEPLVELTAEGGYIPIPDHRIPPDCSLDQFRTYVRVFKEMFEGCAPH
jgi:uroporphyrinogen decarboxylase